MEPSYQGSWRPFPRLDCLAMDRNIDIGRVITQVLETGRCTVKSPGSRTFSGLQSVRRPVLGAEFAA